LLVFIINNLAKFTLETQSTGLTSGFRVTMKHPLATEVITTGGDDGFVHRAGRNLFRDIRVARKCRKKKKTPKKLVSRYLKDAITLSGAIEGNDETYGAYSPYLCHDYGIPCQPLDPKETRDLEPCLYIKTIAGYRVDDTDIDPFIKNSLKDIGHAQALGAMLFYHTRVIGFEKENQRIKTLHVMEVHTGKARLVEREQVINASDTVIQVIPNHLYARTRRKDSEADFAEITQFMDRRDQPIPGGTGITWS